MFTITSAQLKMFSAIYSNILVVFLATIPAVRDVGVLIFNILGIIIFWKLGVKTEEILEGL